MLQHFHLAQLLDVVAADRGLGLVLLGLAALVEYVFPPFPGDAVVVFGAFLVARRGWSAPAVLGVVLAGSAVGSMAMYALGRWLARSEQRWTGRLGRLRPRLDALVARFARHGSLYLAINRFLPSLRALFFVAAGMARLPPAKVLACGLLSAAAWNALLFLIGATVGSSWDRLHAIFQAYGLVVWSAMLLVGAVLLVRWRWRRTRA